MSALGFIEAPFLSVAAVLSDTAAKAAQVRVLGFEATGNENILIRIAGGVADVQAALEAAQRTAETMGSRAIVHAVPRPADGFQPMVHFPNAQNPLYGGRDQLLPTDYHSLTPQLMNNSQDALGILETQGLTAILEATDAMLKSANVTLVGKEKIGAAYVTVIVKGDVAAVSAAIEAGSRAVGQLGKLIAAHVIARPHAELSALLPK